MQVLTVAREKCKFPSGDGQSIFLLLSLSAPADAPGAATGCWAQTVAANAARLTKQSKSRMTIRISSVPIVLAIEDQEAILQEPGNTRRQLRHVVPHHCRFAS